MSYPSSILFDDNIYLVYMYEINKYETCSPVQDCARRNVVLDIRVFGSGRFGLFGFRVIRIGMFRNRLGTGHFLDRFGSDNVGFGSDFYFFIKHEMEPYYK